MGNSHSSISKTERSIRRMRSAPGFSCMSLTPTLRNEPILHWDPSSSQELDEKLVDTKRYNGYHHSTANFSSIELPLPLAYKSTVPLLGLDSDTSADYHLFLQEYPQYKLTWILDNLRRSDYVRLDSSGEAYVDYMGAALYPESLIREHSTFLSRAVMGNTHSISNSSQLSANLVEEARMSVLSFFSAPPETYTVIFTSNASAALKLVGESFPFSSGSKYVLCTDSHNSVHGIRQYALRKDAEVCYIPATNKGGFDDAIGKSILERHKPTSSGNVSNLFALTALSNLSNSKTSLSILNDASSLGYSTLLDAAALAPTSALSIANYAVDAMAISFYKMFGYPTGVGALIVKKRFLERLDRPWFSGGNVDIVQVPGTIITRTSHLEERFEDGTINYLILPAIIDGLRFLSAYLPFLPLRLTCLMHYLISSLSRIRHENGMPVVRILSRKPSKVLKSVGEQSDCGFLAAILFLLPSGQMMPLSFIDYVAQKQNISLRTGCMCNSGGAAALLGIQNDMTRLYPGITLKDFEKAVGRELGVVRISLGLASSFQDIWRLVRFAQGLANEQWRGCYWDSWLKDSGKIGQAL